MPHCRFPALLIAVLGCAGQARGPGGDALESPAATASLVDSSGTTVGLAAFSDSGGTTRLSVSVNGLTPGAHGMHVHENGTCTPPDFQSAGGHFNPEANQHGTENPQGPHAGDLPNLVVGQEGGADTTMAVRSGLLTEGSTSMLGTQGRALVIHADPDDLRTDPSGNSGARVVCGVIERG